MRMSTHHQSQIPLVAAPAVAICVIEPSCISVVAPSSRSSEIFVCGESVCAMIAVPVCSEEVTGAGASTDGGAEISVGTETFVVCAPKTEPCGETAAVTGLTGGAGSATAPKVGAVAYREPPLHHLRHRPK